MAKHSLYQSRPGVWRITITIPKSKPVRRTFHGTREAAEIHGKSLATQYERNGPPNGSPTISLATFLHDRLTREAPALAPGTVRWYRRLIRLYIRPDNVTELRGADPDLWRLAKLSLGRLTAADAEAFQWRLIGRVQPRTIRAVMQLIRSGLDEAVQRQIIPANPWNRQPIVKQRAVRVGTQLPHIRSFHALRQHLRTPQDGEGPEGAFRRQRLGMLFALAINTGARRGELLACCWQHIDWEEGKLRIEGSLDDSTRALVVREPKTRAGWRRIELGEATLAELTAWRARLAPAVLAAGKAIGDLPILPGDPGGVSLWQPAAASQAALRAMQAVGLTGSSLHTIRHANATTLISSGMSPANVARRLGHSSARMTLTLYDGAMPEHDHTMAAIIEAACTHKPGRGRA